MSRRRCRGAGCARRGLGGRRAGVVVVAEREGNSKTVGWEVVARGRDRVGVLERRAWLGGERGSTGLLRFREERGGSGIGRRVVTLAVTFRKP